MIGKFVGLISIRNLFLFGLSPVLSFVYFNSINDPIFSTHRDFGVFYTASTLLWRGDALLLFDPDTFRAALADVMGKDFPYLPFPYPPHSLLFMMALAGLPYLVALAIWLSVGFVGVVAGLWRVLTRDWSSVLAFLLCPASMVNMAGGQNGFISAALLCGGLVQLPYRPALAGLLFGLLSYKPQLGLLIPILLMSTGQWRAFWVAAATVVALVFASALALGPEAWIFYLTKSGPQQLHMAQYWFGRFQAMSPTYFMAGRLLELDLWQAWALQGLSALIAVVAAVWAFRQKSASTQLKTATVLVAIFLISPYLLTYDMTIVSIAILLAMASFRPSWWEYAVMIMAWSLPALTLPSGMPIGPIIITILFFVLLRRVAMARETEAPSTTR